jgi:anti-sigma regulatory factor (Ser/Thr protein kinase)
MEQGFADVLHLVLPCDPRAPGRVRDELEKIEAIQSIRMNAKLVASELVSNAVRHSSCSPCDELDVRARLSDDLFEISVRDPGLSEQTPQVQREPGIGGLGLAIVERAAERWGSTRPGGRVVWAQLSLRATPRSPAGAASDRPGSQLRRELA